MKNKIKIKDLKFAKIINLEEFLKVAKYLSQNLCMSKEREDTLINYILENNQTLFGYSIYSNMDIVGSVLLIDQGYLIHDGDKIPIYNMTAWFVDKEYRGLVPIYMIKKMIIDLGNTIITNLSANKNAYAVLKKMGFKNFYTSNKKIPILGILFIGLLKNRKVKLIKGNKIYKKEKVFLKKANSIDLSLSINKKIIFIRLSKCFYEKKIFGYFLRLKGIRILWVSDKKIFKEFYCTIILFLFKKYKFIFLSTHFLLNKEKYISNHLYNSLIDLDDINMTIGSELSLNL